MGSVIEEEHVARGAWRACCAKTCLMRLRSAQCVFENGRRIKLALSLTFAGWPERRQPMLWNTRESMLRN